MIAISGAVQHVQARAEGLYVAVGVLGVVAAAYITLALAAYLLGDRLIFQPPTRTYSRADLPFRSIPVAGDVSLAAAYWPADSGELTILYSHGNAEDLGQIAPILRQLHALGFGVLAYDYRGYGLSGGGPPTVHKSAADAEAAYDFAVRQLGIDPRRLVAYGRSLGSGPTLQLAAGHPLAGVVLESAFTSVYRVVTGRSIFPFDRFRNLDQIRRLRCPLLVIHGTADRVVPFAHGRTLFAAARTLKESLWVDGAGHNDLEAVAGARYAQALVHFAGLVQRAGPGRPDPGSR